MSAQNVEIVKRVMDAHDRRDLDDFDELTTPDFEWFPAMAVSLGTDVYRGREGIEDYFKDSSEAWDDLRDVQSASEFRDLGDRVLLLTRFAGRGRGSGVEVAAPLGIVFDLRGGKISRIRAYLDHSEALRAAGLTE
jgi:ketosteroid isomerase-like protein